MYNVELPGPPSCLALFYNDGGENGDEVLYGTEDGKIGLLQLTRYFLSQKEKVAAGKTRLKKVDDRSSMG